MEEKKTIIYIMSDVRSGSTLLENLLSKSDEVISVGESRFLSSHINKGRIGRTWDWKCSCGKDILECDFWKNILRDKSADDIKNLKTEIQVDDSILKPLIGRNYGKFWKTEDSKQVTTTLDYIYNKIYETTKKNVIVDSSKNPFQALAFYKNSKYNFKIIYLKRDIRAVSISKRKWVKKNNRNKAKYLYWYLFVTKLYELKCKWVFKRISSPDIITINYKDLAVDYQYEMSKVCGFAKINQFEIPEFMYLDDDHTIAGTPNRFTKRRIAYDEKWKIESKKKLFFNFIGYLIK